VDPSMFGNKTSPGKKLVISVLLQRRMIYFFPFSKKFVISRFIDGALTVAGYMTVRVFQLERITF